MQECKKHEFCNAVKCPSLMHYDSVDEHCLDEDEGQVYCIQTARCFYEWIKDNDYKIIKE